MCNPRTCLNRCGALAADIYSVFCGPDCRALWLGLHGITPKQSAAEKREAAKQVRLAKAAAKALAGAS